MSNLHVVLSTLRQQMNLSQHQFSELVGIHSSMLAAYEAGQTELDAESLAKVTGFFGLTLESPQVVERALSFDVRTTTQQIQRSDMEDSHFEDEQPDYQGEFQRLVERTQRLPRESVMYIFNVLSMLVIHEETQGRSWKLL